MRLIYFIICFFVLTFNSFTYSQIKIRNEDLVKSGLELKTYPSGKCGLLNAKDKKTIGEQNFDKIEYIDHNIWSAKRGNEQFVFNVLSKKFIHSFPVSRAYVRTITPNNIEQPIVYFYVNKKMGIVDLDGKVLLDTLYESISISENYVTYLDKGFYGLISLEKQKQIFPAIYTQISVHKLYFVCNSKENGNILYDADLNEIYKGFKEHKFFLEDNLVFLKDQNKKWGLFDGKQKKMIIPFEYSDISSFGMYKNLFLVKKDNNYGIMNLKNEIVVPIIYSQIDDPIISGPEIINAYSHQKRTSVYNLEGKCLYFNVKNIEYLENYEQLQSFTLNRNKFWRVTDSLGKIGIFDFRNDKTILSLEYVNVQSVFNKFNIVKKEKFFGVKNWKNEILLEEKYDTIVYVLNKPQNQVESFIVKENGKFGVVDSIGNVLIPFKYKDIQAINGFFKVQKNKKYQIVDYNEKPLFNQEFDKVGSFHYAVINSKLVPVCPVSDKGISYLINDKGIKVEDLNIKFIEGYQDFSDFTSKIKAMILTKDEDSLASISKLVFTDDYTKMYFQKFSNDKQKKKEYDIYYQKLIQLRKDLSSCKNVNFELSTPKIQTDRYVLDSYQTIYYPLAVCEYFIHTEKATYRLELWGNANVDGIWKALHFEYTKFDNYWR